MVERFVEPSPLWLHHRLLQREGLRRERECRLPSRDTSRRVEGSHTEWSGGGQHVGRKS